MNSGVFRQLAPNRPAILLLCSIFALAACKRKDEKQDGNRKILGLFTRVTDLPDNGVRKLKINGTAYHYIPLKEAKFLIPDNTWLKGFSTLASDNSVYHVYHIVLHAPPPHFESW